MMRDAAQSPASLIRHPIPELDEICAIFPYGGVTSRRILCGSASLAMIVDYQRENSVSGTWHSRNLHYFDMALTRRPKGAFGQFAGDDGPPQPVGQILLVPAEQHYRGEGGSGRQKSLAVFFDPVRLGGTPDIAEAMAMEPRSCLNLEGESLRGLLARIGREVASPGFASDVLLDALCASLMVETARVIKAAGWRATRKGGLSPRKMKLIHERVMSGPTAPTLAELAQLCGLSARQMMRAFFAETGQTIGAYMQSVMLERAKRMLVTTQRPIAEIGQQLGFSNAAAFSAAFRRLCGQSPRGYRASHTATDIMSFDVIIAPQRRT